MLTAVACDAHGSLRHFGAGQHHHHHSADEHGGADDRQPDAGGDATITNLTSIQVTFSERVVGVDAADLLVNDVPATSVTGSGSNYIFTVTQPPYGPV